MQSDPPCKKRAQPNASSDKKEWTNGAGRGATARRNRSLTNKRHTPQPDPTTEKMIYTAKPEPSNVGQFMSEDGESAMETYERVESEVKDQSSRFLVKDRNFSRQYAHLYAERLWTARPKLIEAAKSKWGK